MVMIKRQLNNLTT